MTPATSSTTARIQRLSTLNHAHIFSCEYNSGVRPSVRLSACLSQRSTAAAAARGGFAADRPAGMRYRLVATGTLRERAAHLLQAPALSSKRG